MASMAALTRIAASMFGIAAVGHPELQNSSDGCRANLGAKEKPLRGAANRFLFLLPATAAETEPKARAAAIITVTRATPIVTVTRAAAGVAITTRHIIAVVAITSLNITGIADSIAASVFVAHKSNLIDIRSLSRLGCSGVHGSRNCWGGQQGSCSKN